LELFLTALQFVYLFCVQSKCILLFFWCISSLLLLFCFCVALCGAETWTFRKVGQGIWKVVNCGAGEVRRNQLDRSCEKWRTARGKRNILSTIYRGTVTGLVTAGVGIRYRNNSI
jgi:hypothetical protein